MKRALNTIPLSKRKHYMSNFFVPRTNNRKPIVSKTPFVGYERAYRSDTLETGGGRQAPTTQCLNPSAPALHGGGLRGALPPSLIYGQAHVVFQRDVLK